MDIEKLIDSVHKHEILYLPRPNRTKRAEKGRGVAEGGGGCWRRRDSFVFYCVLARVCRDARENFRF